MCVLCAHLQPSLEKAQEGLLKREVDWIAPDWDVFFTKPRKKRESTASCGEKRLLARKRLLAGQTPLAGKMLLAGTPISISPSPIFLE